MVRQAQSREKLLQKKLEEGLTEKPQRDAEWDFSFPDPGADSVSVSELQYHEDGVGATSRRRDAVVATARTQASCPRPCS